jgi:aminoglycoside phosphotransferase (APT) family kinase protein
MPSSSSTRRSKSLSPPSAAPASTPSEPIPLLSVPPPPEPAALLDRAQAARENVQRRHSAIAADRSQQLHLNRNLDLVVSPRPAAGNELWQALALRWDRAPGQHLIPPAVLEAVLASLPRAPFRGKITAAEVESFLAEHGHSGLEVQERSAGASGAQIFNVKPLGVLKLFTSAAEMVRDVAALEELARRPGLNPVGTLLAGTTADGRGFSLMEQAAGSVLFDRMDALGVATGGARARELQALLNELQSVGRALGQLHATGARAEKVPEWHQRAAVDRVLGLWEMARASGEISPRDCDEIDVALNRLSFQFEHLSLTATLAIGDIHPGNVAVESRGGEVNVFDVETLFKSLGSDRRGNAPAADDFIWFSETLPWYGKSHGLDSDERDLAQLTFESAYRASAPTLSREPGAEAAEQFFRVRSAMQDLRWGPGDPSNLKAVKHKLGIIDE